MIFLTSIAPYLRIIWAVVILITITTGLFQGPDYSGELNAVSQFLTGVVKVIFAFYCILIGVQEILTRQLTNAKIFNLFGLLFEIIVFACGCWIITFTVTHPKVMKIWELRFSILWQIGILTLIIVDVKKYFQSRSEQEEFS